MTTYFSDPLLLHGPVECAPKIFFLPLVSGLGCPRIWVLIFLCCPLRRCADTTDTLVSARRTSSSVVPESTRSRIMEINPSEFLKYKMEKPLAGAGAGAGAVAGGAGPGDLLGDSPGVSGLLWVHLLAGRGLRASGTPSAATTPSTPSAPTPLGTVLLARGGDHLDTFCTSRKKIK